MSNARRPYVSFILATHNRCDVVRNTLARVAECGLDREDYEVIVVDNASTDGTPDAVASEVDLLLRRRGNEGSCAKALGVERATGHCLVFLDDDSFPRPGSVGRMMERFEDDPRLGAAGFTIHLPNDELEGAALPDVFVGCGVGFRAEALRMVGGLDRTFFMQAEEYDLSFRLVAGGWTVKVFDDLHVDHLKTTRARKSERTTYYDIRNNLRLVARYLASPFYEIYRQDWRQRYAWLAERDRHVDSFRRGARAGKYRGLIERWSCRGRRLSSEMLEHFFGWEFVRERMMELAASGIRRVVLADLGKNVFAFHQAATRAGVEVPAIGDDRFAGDERRYRGTPILALDEALRLSPDAVVVSNSGAVHAARTGNRLRAYSVERVFNWFGGAEVAGPGEFHSPESARLTDEHVSAPVVVPQG